MRVSVVTCTRNRPDQVDRAVRSVLANDYPDFDYLVVDQSEGGLTAKAVRGAAGGDSRLRYVRHSSRGKSRALNYAVTRVRGDVIALMDDDCEARPDWISSLVAEFADGRADVVCGQVLPASPDQGAMTGFRPAGSTLLSRRSCSVRDLGTGSNLAFRRGVPARVGPFDELLGPGAAIPIGEDRDFLYRALRKGCGVRVSPGPSVINHDLSRDADGGSDGGAAILAAASAYWKHIRRGDLVALFRYLADVAGDARAAAGRRLRREGPLDLSPLRHHLAGAVFSLRQGMDREQGVYVGRRRR